LPNRKRRIERLHAKLRPAKKIGEKVASAFEAATLSVYSKRIRENFLARSGFVSQKFGKQASGVKGIEIKNDGINIQTSKMNLCVVYYNEVRVIAFYPGIEMRLS